MNVLHLMGLNHNNKKYLIIKSQNHGMAWVEMDLKDHLVRFLLPCAGVPPMGCPEPHSISPVL